MFPFASGAPSVSAFSVWNSSDVSGSAVFSGGNSIVNANAADTWAGARGQISRNSGKRYCEITLANSNPGADTSSVYLGTSAGTFTTYTGPGKFGLLGASGQYVIIDPSLGGFGEALSSIGTNANDVIGFAYDAGAGKIYISVNGDFYDFNGSLVGALDDARETIDLSVGTTLFPLGMPRQTNSNLTINTNPSSRPIGYTNWG